MINVQEKNQYDREWRMQQRESMTSDEKGESSAKRKAKYAAKKNTPCAESIAMRRPDLTSTMSDSHAFNPHAPPVFRAEAVCLEGGPSMTMPTSTVGTDGKNLLLPQSSTQNSVVPSFAYHLNDVADDMEAFLSGIMGEDPMPPDFMDDDIVMLDPGQQSDSEQIDCAPTVTSAPTYIRNIETDGSYPINDQLSFCIHSSVIYDNSKMLQVPT